MEPLDFKVGITDSFRRWFLHQKAKTWALWAEFGYKALTK